MPTALRVISAPGRNFLERGPGAEELLTLAMSVKRFSSALLLLPSDSTLAQELVTRAE